jgi:hypothetical protein
LYLSAIESALPPRNPQDDVAEGLTWAAKIAQPIGFHGDLTIVAVPRGSQWSITLSDQPNVRAPEQPSWNFSGANTTPVNPPPSPKASLVERHGATTARKAKAILQAARAPTSGIPEPSTWAMMLAGFAGLAFAGFRARRTAVAAVWRGCAKTAAAAIGTPPPAAG